MSKKLIFIISILGFSLIFTSCQQSDRYPSIVNLEETIEEIINSKGKNYDFLKDELYIEKMNELVEKFIDKGIIKPENFVFGNLDDDTIPEIIVFRERKFDDPNDTGYLEVYKFNGKTYDLLDSTTMNYDNSNYDLKVGKISKHENGIYLSNQVGKGFGFTYGFVLRDGKLTSILNEKMLNLISIEPINEIKDIDNDGILEFSIYTIDPESQKEDIEDKDKLLLWYKWDGLDSANLVEMEKINIENSKDIKSNKDILETSKKLLEDNDTSFLEYLKKNNKDLSNNDITQLLQIYISNLQSQTNTISLDLKDIYKEYKIPLNKINDIDYIRSEDMISLDMEIKQDMIEKLKLGYKIELIDKNYEYVVNHEFFIKEFGENISNEYKDLLKIMNIEDYEDISFEKFTQKITMMENFIITYPYSQSIDEIKKIINQNIYTFIKRTYENPITQEQREFLEENYQHTYLFENIKILIDKEK